MKKKDIIYIPGQDKWSEHFPTPGKLRPSNFGHIFGDTPIPIQQVTPYPTETKK